LNVVDTLHVKLKCNVSYWSLLVCLDTSIQILLSINSRSFVAGEKKHCLHAGVALPVCSDGGLKP